MNDTIAVLISLFVIGVNIALVVRFFAYTGDSQAHNRAQTSLLALIARQQNEPKNTEVNKEIFRIIADNGLLNEVPVKRDE